MDALKKAAPPSDGGTKSSPATKPLIFEKISFEKPSPITIKRELKHSRLPAAGDESRRFLTVLATLLAGSILAAVWLWPKPVPDFSSPKIEELSARLAGLEAELAQKNEEVTLLQSSLQAATAPAESAGGELEAARAQITAMNRKLSIMLDDNLRKDEEIARLTSRRTAERMLD